MNDPNGPMVVDGYYHLFYQCNPYGTTWGNMSWAHVVSQDMITWQRMPIAMYNDKSYNIDGVFSGSAVLNSGSPVLFYTCVNSDGVQLQCASFPSSSDTSTLSSWDQSPQNPIISSTPSDWDGINFRDPTVWELSSEQSWSMATAATNDHTDDNSVGNGIIAIYSSPSSSFPYDWTYEGPLWSSDNPTAGFHTWMVECPDFYPSTPGESYQRDTAQPYVLKYSVMDTWQEFYEVGAYDSNPAQGPLSSSFVRDLSYTYPSYSQPVSGVGDYPALLLDYGPNGSFYASKTFYDSEKDRRILWGWSKEADGNSPGRDWQGVQSLPRLVQLDTSLKTLRTTPIPEVNALRGYSMYRYNRRDKSDTLSDRTPEGIYELPVTGQQLNVEATFSATVDCNLSKLDGWNFGILARRSADGTAYSKYGFSLSSADSSGSVSASLVMDSTYSGGSTPVQVVSNPLPGVAPSSTATGLQFQMSLYLDHSMTELFVQDGQAAGTMRIYPSSSNQGLAWYLESPVSPVEGCELSLYMMQVYAMRGIWE